MDGPTLATTQALAARLAQGVRDARLDAAGVDLLTQEFSLDSREGIALMCLAEAMLRIPDTETRNQLIRDKIVDADWRAHIGKSPSLFVNATAWGLLITGKLLKQPDENALNEALMSVLRKGGEAVVRAGVAYAMRMLGKQFVTGQTIEEAIGAAKARESGGYRYSYDMLGEAALTDDDAQAYFESYRHAIEAIGRDAKGGGPIHGPGVSVKISGLHPRYELAQRERVMVELYPRLLQLAEFAKKSGIGFHLDQEESARFELTLDMLERLCNEPGLRGWDGIGISLQAYQKRGRAVADWIVALARATRHRINVRLVKGAYWDTEIKLAQDAGAADYPVFTRKVHSDVSYIACAKTLLDAPDAVFPQFASHNAFTIAAVHTLAGTKDYEFQCLHGMGETVYDQVVGQSKLGRPCRIYAPVGPHATLLAYLVRRLLENGANSSFVNQIVDPAFSIADMVEDPVAKAARTGGKPHGGIAAPSKVLPGRVNAASISFGDSAEFDAALTDLRMNRIVAKSIVAGIHDEAVDTRFVYSAADHAEVVGTVACATLSIAEHALAAAAQASATRATTSVGERASILDSMASALERKAHRLGALLVLENGATMVEAADEVRTAVNLCRLYACQLRADERMRSSNALGVVVSMTPAFSPLSALVGHIAAGLAAGNAVISKPSSDANLVAYEVVRLFLSSGVPQSALQLLLGEGGAVISDERVAAVMFAGSSETSRSIAAELAELAEPPRFLSAVSSANSMIVDSSALPEQVISDAMISAFKGAGQTASSLKILCLQDSTAEKVLHMLRGMLSERITGSPLDAATDIGPVSTREIQARVERYLTRMESRGFSVTRGKLSNNSAKGNFVAPAIVEIIDLQSLSDIDPAITGPVLHVVRWKTGAMNALVDKLNELGCGVQGLHTRINEAAGKLLSRTRANSVCINRSTHKPFIGMQPYGGAGAAGTGPMAGGPLTLMALTRDIPDSFSSASGPFAASSPLANGMFYEFPSEENDGKLRSRRDAMQHRRNANKGRLTVLVALATEWKMTSGSIALATTIGQLTRLVDATGPLALPALTGEENTVELLPQGQILCAGDTAISVITQAMVASAFGNDVILLKSSFSDDISNSLAGACRIVDSRDALTVLRGEIEGVRPFAVLIDRYWADAASLQRAAMLSHVAVVLADTSGHYDWTQVVRERVTTVNASAAGGNTQLMILSEDIV